MKRSQSSRIRSLNVQPLLAAVVIIAVLYAAKAVFVPIALAILLTFVLVPVVAMIERWGVGRVPAVLLTVLLTIALFGAMGSIVGLQIHHLARDLPTHRQEIDSKIASLRGSGEGTLGKLIQMLREISKGETAIDVTSLTEPKEIAVVANDQHDSSFEQLTTAVVPILEPLAQAGMIVILVVFMLIKREDLRNRVIGVVGHGHLMATTHILADSAERVSRLLLTQLLVNLTFGFLFASGLLFAGVPYAFLWGFLAAALRFVPYIGSTVAVAFPLVLAFAVAPGWRMPIQVFGLFALLELITANGVEPLLFGHGTGVAPIALVVAAAFWTWIWGPIGLVLSTPLTVCLVVLGMHVPRVRFLAMLLGDQPALVPHVHYYQRLLARDVYEAGQVATVFLRTNELANLYDEVLLPALRRARRDRTRGELTAEDESFILQATKEIMQSVANSTASLNQLSSNNVPLPANAGDAADRSEVLIFGCPAHHETEELAIEMLAQLLKPDGLQAQVVSTRVLTTEIIRRIDIEKPAIVFVAILPPGGFVQARYLCKSLRKRFADLPIVVGYLGYRRHYDRVLVRLRSAGASYLTTSLLQSRSQILTLVNRIQRTALERATTTASPISDVAAAEGLYSRERGES